MSRRFLLADLTPKTRDLYRAMRNARMAADAAYREVELTQDRQVMYSTSLFHIDNDPTVSAETRAATVERRDAATAAYNEACDVWTQATDRLKAAFWAAVPAMESEGYDRRWFNNARCTVQLPQGVESPGRNRPGRRRAVAA
jgi:hypothetical protein